MSGAEDLESRVAKLEAIVERQDALLESHREDGTGTLERGDASEGGTATGVRDPPTGEERATETVRHGKSDGGGSPNLLSRRSALAGLGAVGLLGFGAGSSAAAPSGRVGTEDRPLKALYAERIGGGLSGDPFTVETDGVRALRLGLPGSGGGGASVVAGHPANDATGAEGVVVAGGGSDGAANVAYDEFGTIGGGANNAAGNDDGNTGSARYATVGGGSGNEARGAYATVPGGTENQATGAYSFAAGRNATATHDGSYVFGDASGTGATSNAADEARFQTDIVVEGDLSFDDGTTQRTVGPVAKGFVDENDVNAVQTIGVDSVTWNSSASRYEIAFSDISYDHEDNVTAVTPVGVEGSVCSTGSGAHTLNVYFENDQEGSFHFVVWEL